MNRVGPRTRTWNAAWRFLKPRLEATGRTGCEFSFIPHVCSGPLDPAHSRKRNKIQGDQIYEVAIACRHIHEHMDLRMSHEEMEAAVLQAIENGGGMILPERKAA